MKKQTLLIALSMLCLMVIACSPKKNTEEKKVGYTIAEKPIVDSALGFKLGDVFIADSLPAYGFVVVEIEKETEALSFIPVKLAEGANDLDRLKNGDIRFVPSNIDNPKSGDYGIECMGAMGDKQLKEIREKFKQAGHINLKRPLPRLSAVLYGTLSSEGLNSFARHHTYASDGQSKMIKAQTIIE